MAPLTTHLAVEEVGDPLDVLHQLAVARVARKGREHVLQEAGATRGSKIAVRIISRALLLVEACVGGPQRPLCHLKAGTHKRAAAARSAPEHMSSRQASLYQS